jgi:hypothetical protein
MLFFTNILKWITDPKNRTILLFLFIALLIGLFVYQRNRTQKFKFKYEEEVKETNRIKNNWVASEDTLKLILDKNGRLTGEISGYKLTADELATQYDSLFSLYRIERNKPPKVIIEYKYIIKERITNISTQVTDSTVTLYDSIDYGGGNWRVIEATIPYKLIYKIKSDSANAYEFTKALRFAFELRQNGITDAFVVLYENNKRISYIDSKNLDSLIYMVQIYATNTDFSEKYIAEKFNLKDKDIHKTFEDGIYKYLTGMFIPSTNINTVVHAKDIYTYANVISGLATGDIRLGMKLGSALIEDPKTGEIKIQVTSDYPDITFKDIKGAEIMSTLKNNKKVTKQFRKEFGIGLHLGVGVYPAAVNNTFQMKVSPVLSIGINYTPRFLQFGASQTGNNSINDLINGE